MPLSRLHRRWAFAALAGSFVGGLVAFLRTTEPSPSKDERTLLAAASRTAPSSSSAAPGASALPGALSAGETLTASVKPASVISPRGEPDAAVEGEPRVYSKTRFVWIRERPDWDSQWIGYMWPGDSVRLSSPKPIYARGCDAWYAVLPRGYVCMDRRRTTLDPEDPDLAEVRRSTPDPLGASPYRYASSLGAERYATLPSRAEQLAREPDLEQHLALIERARNGGALDPTLDGIDLTPAADEAVAFAHLPADVQFSRRSLRRDSTLAFVGEFLHDGRTFLLTPDFTWVPKDRVRPFPPVTFHGLRLGSGTALPIAFFRERARPSYHRLASGAFERSTRDFPRLGMVALTGRIEDSDGERYLETREPGVWLREPDAVVPKLREHTPWGAHIGAPDKSKNRPRGRATWLDTSVYGGWLVAYEDTTPVFATLMAPGRGGAAPASSPDLTATSSTPLGAFPISGKFLTANMDGPDEVVHSNVPWVQNFRGPHSIHGAYWHDAWGERVSGGCLNVSPEDARFLFGFTDPKLPEGWHGVRWNPRLEAATLVVIHP